MKIKPTSLVRAWAQQWTKHIFYNKSLDYQEVQAIRLRDVKPIHECAAASIHKPSDIGHLVEWPLIRAVVELWMKGIETTQTSCHGEDRHDYASIVINRETLSEENEKFLRDNPHFELVRVEEAWALRFKISWESNPTVIKIEEIVLQGIEGFENQRGNHIKGAPLEWMFENTSLKALEQGKKSVEELFIERNLTQEVYFKGRVYNSLMELQIAENWKSLEEMMPFFESGEIKTIAKSLQTLDPEMVLEFT